MLEVRFLPGKFPRIGEERVLGKLPEGVGPLDLDADPATGDLVMIERPAVPDSDRVRLILNWGAELARQSRNQR